MFSGSVRGGEHGGQVGNSAVLFLVVGAFLGVEFG
jgi:hypothetical protein